ncbi:heme A synthase [Corynebacterium sp. 153RC1]|uniref:COX15/CtaA family protein n=1 Tax=unclassified Corynebacterium TaxID=2624378 RepID=UPI00211BA891|nr:heme A synthase [Corynebacterium sp. 209RC1]MCQ9354438.1 heme A synthase [Corynebacterium sp. 1222RC1]MCQ9356673.1 heme A synthase [Corynebacterium sp. 122RC1]MCQ9358833.1 heme A synthase [Corynebacterium sp. 142RC1]MCQ9361231.1 heme A synthase [Corynebacterium sp. 153RC1]MCQ9364166.1 heme A synthase [Corynebacterium sp. 732RC1]MCQ9366268.1 heme A synthase [Corynebacterium sp. 70RC1]MCQ9369731.1 heme A synthase [Corynebacterium sp. 35RC1]
MSSLTTAPSIQTQRKLALSLLLAQGGITVTGSIVRVTGSGLGCNTWPNCHPGSLVPVPGAAPWIHQAVEFGNRLLTFVLVALTVAVFVAVLRAGRRKEIIIHSVIQGVGVIIQAVIGGISVWLDLKWWAVALHFLPSMLLVWLAAILFVRVGEPDDGEVRYTYSSGLRWLAALGAVLLSGVLMTGTMVTGAGPHSGDDGVGMEGRLEVDIDWIAHVHAWVMYAYLAATVLLLIGLILQQAPQRQRNQAWLLIGMILVQAAVGIGQYHLQVPRWSVPIHIGLCSFVVAATAILWAIGKVRVGGQATLTGSPAGDAKRTVTV